MTHQRCFTGMRPPQPTLRTRAVAEEVARRIVVEVNLDDFYWTAEEVPERIADVAEEIMRVGLPATVFTRLYGKQSARSGHPYGWDGIGEHCGHIADDIVTDGVSKAVKDYHRDYRG